MRVAPWLAFGSPQEGYKSFLFRLGFPPSNPSALRVVWACSLILAVADPLVRQGEAPGIPSEGHLLLRRALLTGMTGAQLSGAWL